MAVIYSFGHHSKNNGKATTNNAQPKSERIGPEEE